MLFASGPQGIDIDLGTAQIEIAYGGVGNNRFDASTAAAFVIAEGGDGDDQLIGSTYDDLLSRGRGADVIDGGLGFDAVALSGLVQDHLIYIDTDSGHVRITAAVSGDVDTLNNVQHLLFANRAVGLVGDNITCTGADATFDNGGTSLLFSGTDDT